MKETKRFVRRHPIEDTAPLLCSDGSSPPPIEGENGTMFSDIENTGIEAVAITAVEASTIHGATEQLQLDTADDEGLYTWRDTYFVNNAGADSGTIQLVFDHQPVTWKNSPWGPVYVVCTIFGILIVSGLLLMDAGDSIIFLSALVGFVVTILCACFDCLSVAFPAATICHTALTTTGIRHVLVPQRFAPLERPCVIKIPYTDITDVVIGTATDSYSFIRVRTKTRIDESKYIAAGKPLPETFSTMPVVVLNLRDILEPYQFKRITMRQIASIADRTEQNIENDESLEN